VSEDALRVALTFDAEHPDRPGALPGTVDRILSILAEASARASFFVQGRWAEAEPESVRRIVEDGHLVANHSHHHARMTMLSDDGIRSDVAAADDAVFATTGSRTRPFFRCPFGDGHDDTRVLRVLRQEGYRNVHWHVELEDWEPWRRADEIADDAVGGVDRRGDGTVVLLHTWPSHTAVALPAILEQLDGRGARFVGIDELPEGSFP
jgi:peptidoglycan-N-acetylglucosamine deacetylase